MDDEIKVWITEIRRDILYIKETLIRLESQALNDHEHRLRSLEGNDKKWAVAAVILAGVVSVAVKFLWP